MTDHGSNTVPRGIECPDCGCRHLFVLYTRQRTNKILRVRRCRNCQRRILTYEHIIGQRSSETNGSTPHIDVR